MDASERFLSAAEEQVKQALISPAHKIKTALKMAARAQLKALPRRLAASVGVLIPLPMVGSVLNAAIDAAIAKFKQDFMARKRVRLARNLIGAHSPDIEEIRAAAKADLKDAKVMLERLDGNLTKLNAHNGDLAKKAQAFGLAVKGNGGIDAFNSAAWDAAIELQYVTHYEEKCQLMVDLLRLRLDAVADYLAASRDSSARVERAFIDDVDDYLEPAPTSPLRVHLAEEPPRQGLRIHLAPE